MSLKLHKKGKGKEDGDEEELLAKALQHPQVTEEEKENLLKGMYWRNVEEKLKHAPDEVKGDREFMIRAVQKSGGEALKYASVELREDEEILMRAKENLLKFMNNWNVDRKLKDAPDEVKGDREFILRAVQKSGGHARKYASEELLGDEEILTRAKENLLKFMYEKNVDEKLKDAPDEIKGDREFMLRAIQKSRGCTFKYASEELRGDRQIVMAAIQQWGYFLKFASEELRGDSDIVLAAVQQEADALKDATEERRGDKEIVLAAIQKDGNLLRYASNNLRSDKDVIISAVKQQPTALKFALNGMNQDRDCLKAAGLFDEKYDALASNNAPRIVLSTKFSLGEKTTAYATEVALQMKAKSFFEAKVVYSPNAWDKNTCDKDWTNIDHPCRGTPATCKKYIFSRDDVPIEHKCCWRSSFRYQLMKAKETGGFMVQVAEFDDDRGLQGVQDHVLGNGQQIETELAEQVGVKVFRIYQQKRTAWSWYVRENGKESISNLIDKLVVFAEYWNKYERDDMSFDDRYVEEVCLEDIIIDDED